MAGHSKWANIKHRKAAQVKKRGKIFTKLICDITIAARTAAGSDLTVNPVLQLVVDKILTANMTKDTIERAIKRGSAEADDVNYEEIRYQGYGPAGIALIVDCSSDNRNCTVSDVRHAFSKSGGNLGTDGSVAYMVNKLGIISYPVDCDQNPLIEVALEAAA